VRGLLVPPAPLGILLPVPEPLGEEGGEEVPPAESIPPYAPSPDDPLLAVSLIRVPELNPNNKADVKNIGPPHFI
jgi:hypothetical protein